MFVGHGCGAVTRLILRSGAVNDIVLRDLCGDEGVCFCHRFNGIENETRRIFYFWSMLVSKTRTNGRHIYDGGTEDGEGK